MFINNDPLVRKIAEIAHEANRAYCITQGDFSQKPWNEAPGWQRASAVNGVVFHLNNPDMTAKQSHENWLEEKRANNWSYGPVKDEVRKTHPCFLPYEQLLIEQQIKDHIFRSVVHGCHAARNHLG